MTRHDPFFKEQVVEDYLSNLLTESDTPDAMFASEEALKLAKASELLAKANVTPSTQTIYGDNALKSQQDHKEIESQVENNTEDEFDASVSSFLKDRLDANFQALFFDVAGLTLAVPLADLGGIHQITSVSHMIGKPAWFKGVMIKGEEKFNCVDSAQWIMPEQYAGKEDTSVDYNYLVMLGTSPWGLMCEALITTTELNQDEIKWRSDTSKRPWLAGMVKEKMCALIDVSRFVQMLESGTKRN